MGMGALKAQAMKFWLFWPRLCNNDPQLHWHTLPSPPHGGMRSQDFGNQVSCPGNNTPSSDIAMKHWIEKQPNEKQFVRRSG